VIFQFMAAPDQTLRCVKAANADIFFMLGLSPGLGSKPPADDKKRRLDAILVEDAKQAWSRMDSLGAEQDVRPRAVVECKRYKLLGRESRTRVSDRRRSFFRHDGAGNTVAANRRGVARIGAGCEMAGTTTSAEHSNTGD
jgi:hypothetical protein